MGNVSKDMTWEAKSSPGLRYLSLMVILPSSGPLCL